jgi:hypothetical protein
LKVYESPHLGSSLVEDFTEAASRYRQAYSRYGPWDASFWLPFTDPELGHGVAAVERRARGRALAALEGWFANRLMFKVEATVGGLLAWQGVVWEMELTVEGFTTRKSMEPLYNAVRVNYVDHSNATQQTAWYTNETSVRRYGRRELVIARNRIAQAEAEAEAARRLELVSRPAEEPLPAPNVDDGLLVQCVGLIFTANNRYVTAGDNTLKNRDVVIRGIVDTDCDFLTPRSFTPNTLQARASSDGIPRRAWDAIRRLLEAGDGSQPYAFEVGPGGAVRYGPVDPTPRYEWRGREQGYRDQHGQPAFWLMRPAVVRNMMRSAGAPAPGTFLLDIRDSWPAEVETHEGAAYPDVKPGGTDYNLVTVQEHYARWIAEEGRR